MSEQKRKYFCTRCDGYFSPQKPRHNSRTCPINKMTSEQLVEHRRNLDDLRLKIVPDFITRIEDNYENDPEYIKQMNDWLG